MSWASGHRGRLTDVAGFHAFDAADSAAKENVVVLFLRVGGTLRSLKKG